MNVMDSETFRMTKVPLFIREYRHTGSQICLRDLKKKSNFPIILLLSLS